MPRPNAEEAARRVTTCEQQRLEPLDANCPSRLFLDEVMDKWSGYILAVLDEEPMRFNAIRRRLDGVTQKALTQSLRRLERNGLVTRTVVPSAPVAVEYRLTPLGLGLRRPFLALYDWTRDHLGEVEAARARFDERR